MLDKGCVVEYGHPWELLRKKDGSFRAMCDASGEYDTLELSALGPGLLARAHGADEWVSVAAVRRTVELYRRLVVDFCANGGTDE